MLRFFLPLLLPMAYSWLEAQERRILVQGVRLTPEEFLDAQAIGVSRPEKIRLLKVERVPLPANKLLQMAGKTAGLLSFQTAGLCAGYGIFVRAKYWRERWLVAHEMVHTLQCERLGGLRPFLKEYLRQCLTVGYAAAALELEAVETGARICL